MSFATSASNSHAILATTGLLANSVVIGASIWVFFVQSPALFSFMGRSKFIPPMMKLTKVLFRWTLPVAASLALGTNLLLSSTKEVSASTTCAAVSLAAILINSLVIVPKALAAGAKATTKKDENAAAAAASTKTDFAISGGDGSEKSVTKTLHQTVVVFVTVMLVASVGFVHFTILEQPARNG